ncbi:hypothetical protein, partial [Pantoea sp. PNA 03-3]
SGFTHGDLLRGHNQYVGRSLKVNGSFYRDAYKTARLLIIHSINMKPPPKQYEGVIADHFQNFNKKALADGESAGLSGYHRLFATELLRAEQQHATSTVGNHIPSIGKSK